jgi:VWFA-related protein
VQSLRLLPIARALIALALGTATLTARQTPTFRTSVEYVELDAVVTDKQDRPIKELKKEDFEIVEHGRSQTIANFQAIVIPSVRRAVIDAKTALPSIDVVSNSHPTIARQWVMVIDDLHIMATHIVHTQRVVREFLEQIPESDQVAIVFVGRSDLSQDFTSDLGAQIRTVARIKDAVGFAPDIFDYIQPPLKAPSAERRHNERSTLDVIQNVGRSLIRSTYPRKALVFISEGSTFELPPRDLNDLDARDVFDQQVLMLKDVERSGVPVYTVDPRGPIDCSSSYGDCAGDPSLSLNAKNQNTQLRTIAENTGGRAFVGASDMPRAIRELIEDNSAFYLLGYYPDPIARDGKFHDVDVRVKGHPDYKVRARAGYTAPKPAKATAEETKVTLEDALSSPLPMPGLELRAAAAPVAIGEKGMKTAVTLEVRYPTQPAGKIDDNLSFGIIALDHDGKIKASMRGSYKYSATIKNGQEVVYAINAMVDLPAQPLTLRVAVASPLLDRAASIHVPVEVINPNRDTLQFGSVLLGFAGAPRETAVPAGALKGLVPIQPTMDRVFAESDTLQMFAPLFWRDRGSMPGTQSAFVNVVIRKGSAAVRDTRADLSGEPTGNFTATHALTAQLKGSVPLRGLPPGSYVLELTARLPIGSATKKEIAFEIR